MRKKQKEKCRWTTNEGIQCKYNAVGNSRLCLTHNLTVRFRTQVIIGLITLLLGALVGIFIPDIRRIIIHERTFLENIKIEGDKALKNKERQQTFIYSHKLHDLGIQALGNGDYNSYHEAIWQLLRLHEFYLTSDTSIDPTSSLEWKEISGQLNSLITAKRLELTHCLQIHYKLGETAVAGTKKSVIDYNRKMFFSDQLFAGTLELMKSIADTLWIKEDTTFARLISGMMIEVFIAEAHRRQDQGYKICPRPDDMLQITFMGERIADSGQPRELDSFYRACYIISRLPGPLFNEIINTAEQHYKLSINSVETNQEKADTISVSNLINRWKYFHPYSIIGTIYFEKKPLLDSLIAVSNQKGSEATECVKQLLIRERNPKKWKES